MTITQLKEIYINNKNAAWKKAYDLVVMRFLDEGNSISESYALADNFLMEMNWRMSNPE